MIAPGVSAGLDGDKTITSFTIGEDASTAGEIRVQRRIVIVLVVAIAAGGIGLPDLDQRFAHRPAVFFEHAAADDDALTYRRLQMLTRQVVVDRSQVVAA